MGRVALWIAQLTTSTMPGRPDGSMRTGVDGPGAPPGGPGGAPGGGPRGGEMMRDGADRMVRYTSDGDHHWWMFGLVVIIALAVIGLAVWAIVAFSRAARDRTAALAGSAEPSARNLLDQRLAQGDISPEDYEARRKLLDG